MDRDQTDQTGPTAVLRAPILLFSIAHLAWAGCSSDDPNVRRVEVEVVKKSQSEVTKHTGKPEPVYSTSFAIRLAELALREQGVTDCQRRNVAVSYCDGIYTVTFERPEDRVMAKDYAVDIESDTSRIVRVDTGK